MAYIRIRKEGLTLTDNRRQHFVRSVEDVQRQHDQERAMMDEPDASSAGGITYLKSGFGKPVKMSVREASDSLVQTLKRRGFRVLLLSDVVKTVDKPDLPPCQMLSVYHPALAGRAFELVPYVGLAVCHAVIRQDMSDVVHVEFLDPTLASPLARYSELDGITHDLKANLMTVLQEF